MYRLRERTSELVNERTNEGTNKRERTKEKGYTNIHVFSRLLNIMNSFYYQCQLAISHESL